jgi:hypothetical protein
LRSRGILPRCSPAVGWAGLDVYYDADGNVLTQENIYAPTLKNTYTYDAANRLTNWYVGSNSTAIDVRLAGRAGRHVK